MDFRVTAEQVQRIGLNALKTLNRTATPTGEPMKISDNAAALERGEYVSVSSGELAELKAFAPKLTITVHGRTGARYKISGSRNEK